MSSKIKKGFEFVEHTADLKFVAYGETLDSCFENSARAMFSAIVDFDSISVVEKQEISIEAPEIETLLHDWLTELLFLFSTKNVIFRDFKISVRRDKNYKLDGIASGEKFDQKRHHIKAEVKAVTYHELYIKKKDNFWIAQVVCDT